MRILAWARAATQPLGAVAGLFMGLLAGAALSCASAAAQTASESASHAASSEIAEAQQVIDAHMIAPRLQLDPTAPSLEAALKAADAQARFVSLIRSPATDSPLRIPGVATLRALEAKLIELEGAVYLVPNRASLLRGYDLDQPAQLLAIGAAATPDLDAAIAALGGVGTQSFAELALRVSVRGEIRDIAVALPVGRSIAADPSPPVEIYRENDRVVARIDRFDFPSARAAIEDAARGRPAKGIVFDLRTSIGGSVYAALDILHAFARKGETVARAVPALEGTENFVAPEDGALAGMPVEIWTSHLTYSAAEFFTHAMRALAGAEVIGEQTSGKCVAQQEFALSDGARLLLPVSELRDAAGVGCLGVGATPHHRVSASRVFSESFPPEIVYRKALWCRESSFASEAEVRDLISANGGYGGLAIRQGVQDWRACSLETDRSGAELSLGGAVRWVLLE